MPLSDYVNTFGQHMLRQYGERVHKIAIDAGFSCPNRDGSKGVGGCTFCNNQSFSPKQQPGIDSQINAGRCVIRKRTRARKYLAYFQAYTSTYGEVEHLRRQYLQALQHEDVIGLCIGTRPDCVPDAVLDLLCEIRGRGFHVLIELGLQSAHDDTLRSVNRGHSFIDYQQAAERIHQRGIPLCTHLILGLPGEDFEQMYASLMSVIAHGVSGLKLHPLHVVKGTQLARQWKHNEYQPLSLQEYIEYASSMIEATPADVQYHRVTGTARSELLLAPAWCAKKWQVINGIEQELKNRSSFQGRFYIAPDFHSQVVN